MGHLDYIYYAAVFMMAAIFVVTIMRRFKITPVLGYLLAGLLVGPSLLGFIRDPKAATDLAEMGVLFLLFSIGLSLPLERLKRLSKYVFGFGLAQVVISTCLLGGVAFLFGMTPSASFIIGGALALSSTAVVMQILSENGELAIKFGRASFSVLLFQDFAVVLLLILLATMGPGERGIADAFFPSVAKAVLVLGGIFAVGRYLLRPVFRVVASTETPEMFTAMTILVVFVTALATSKGGLSSELGAFIAGTILAGSEYRHQIEADIQPFRGLLLGLFFMTIGMTIDLQLLYHNLHMIALIVSVFFAIKIVVILCLAPVFGLGLYSAIRIALLLAAGGEFAFVIFPVAAEYGILSPHVTSLLNVSVAISMALTPLFSALGKRIAERLSPKFTVDLVSAQKEVKDLSGHVIIGGYGRVGRVVAKILTENFIPFIAVDKDMTRVSEGRSHGVPVFFGDIRRLEVLRAIGASRAKVLLINDHPNFALRNIQMIRKAFKDMSVCVRARDAVQGDKLRQEGCTVVLPNIIEPTLQTAFHVLSAVNMPKDEVSQILETFQHTQKDYI